MTEKICLDIKNVEDTKQLAERVACYYQKQNMTNNSCYIIYLIGNLGAGKTTFARCFIQAFDPNCKVKSPTYTLIENYSINNYTIYHLDLYRLSDPEELSYLALDDFTNNPNTVVLIEWPSKGEGYIPEPNLIIDLNYQDDSRTADLLFNTINIKLWQDIK